MQSVELPSLDLTLDSVHNSKEKAQKDEEMSKVQKSIKIVTEAI